MLRFLIGLAIGFGAGVIWALPDDFLNRALIKERQQRQKEANSSPR